MPARSRSRPGRFWRSCIQALTSPLLRASQTPLVPLSFPLALMGFPIACSLAGLGKCFSRSLTGEDGDGDVSWWRKIPRPYCMLLVLEQRRYVSLNRLVPCEMVKRMKCLSQWHPEQDCSPGGP